MSKFLSEEWATEVTAALNAHVLDLVEAVLVPGPRTDDLYAPIIAVARRIDLRFASYCGLSHSREWQILT